MDFREALSHVERLPSLHDIKDLLVEEALKRSNGVIKDAGELLGISSQAICNRRARARLKAVSRAMDHA